MENFNRTELINMLVMIVKEYIENGNREESCIDEVSYV